MNAGGAKIGAVALVGLLVSGLAAGGEGLSALSQGTFARRRYGAGTHNRGGLELAVRVDGWPRLGNFQRHWQGQLFPDFGCAAVGGAGKPDRMARTEADWVHEKYEFTGGGKTLSLWVSRLSPAVLFHTDAPNLVLFTDARFASRRGHKNEKKVTPPEFLAVASGRGTRVVKRGEGAAARPRERWAVVWFGPDAFQELGEGGAGDGERVWRRLKRPFLVAFGGTPDALSLTERGLEIARRGGVGHVAVLPLHGDRWLPLEDVEKWAEGLPAEEAERAGKLARMVGKFPVAVKESFAVDRAKDVVSIRNEFSYVNMAGDGKGTGPVAPLPPVVALARMYGLKVELDGEPVDPDYPTIPGPYVYIPGRDTLTYEVHGLLKYLREKPVYSKLDRADREVVGGLERELERMIEAGHIAPARLHFGAIEWDFYDPAELTFTLVEAMKCLPEGSPVREKTLAYLREEIKKHSPVKTGGMPKGEGLRRENYIVRESDLKGLVGGGVRVASLYPVWAYADFTGDWEYAAGGWRAARAALTSQYVRYADWAIGFNGGAAWELNETIQGLIGYARLADGLGKGGVDLAEYLAVKALVARYALSKEAFYFERSGQNHFWDLMEARKEAPTMGHGSYSYQGAAPDFLYLHKLFKRGVFKLEPEAAEELARLAGNLPGRDMRNTRQVAYLTEFWRVLALTQDPRQHMIFYIVPVERFGPEGFRFARELLQDDIRRYQVLLEAKMPGWHLTDPYTRGIWLRHMFRDWGIESPRRCWALFLSRAYVLGARHEWLAARLDIPYCIGDWLHIQKLVATIRSAGECGWEPARREN